MKKRFLAGLLCAGMLLLSACGTAVIEPSETPESTSLSTPLAAAPSGSDFSDVDTDAWYAEAVNWCRANDITDGTGNNNFSPDVTMTRAMLATVLHRVADTPKANGAIPFSDVDADTWYTDAVVWAAHPAAMWR